MESMAAFDYLYWQPPTEGEARSDEAWRISDAKRTKECCICLDDVVKHERQGVYYWSCKRGCTRFEQEVA